MFDNYGFYTESVIPYMDEAKKICIDTGFVNGIPNSITKGKNNELSKASELAVCAFTGGKLDQSFKHDLKIGDVEIEVKCKVRNFYATPSWLAEYSEYQFHQLMVDNQNKIICFCNYNQKSYDHQIIGFCSVKKFKQKARLIKKGTERGNGLNPYQSDTLVLEYREMLSPQEFLKWLNEKRVK